MGNATTTLWSQPEVPATTVERVEYWTRPLVSAVASSLGGKHSFVVVVLKDGTRHLVEKHHDGQVEWRVISQKERVALEVQKAQGGYNKQYIASASHVRTGVTIEDLKSVAAVHEGYYDVHESNCHLCSQAVWNATVKEGKQIDAQEQRHLSKIAQWMGIGASMRADAAATQQQEFPHKKPKVPKDHDVIVMNNGSCNQSMTQSERYVALTPDYRLKGICSY